MTENTHAHIAVNYIKPKIGDFTPKTAIVTGSGLDSLAEEIDTVATIAYKDIPGFPTCSVKSHPGQLVFGHLQGKPVVCAQGRPHFYEGHSNSTMQIMLRTLKLLGCELMLGTNASGSLREEVIPGHVVVISDHINLSFHNPLIGKNDDTIGPRFIGMEDAYDPTLRQRCLDIANRLSMPVSEGVYLGVSGPAFETPAEIRAFRTLGADVVGMSTIPDVIIARHCGMKVLVIAAISNLAVGLSNVKLSHKVTVEGAQLAMEHVSTLIHELIKTL